MDWKRIKELTNITRDNLFDKLVDTFIKSYSDWYTYKYLYSGYMNQWLSDDNYWLFLYKQPRVYHWEGITHKFRQEEPSIYKQRLWLIENGWWRHPIHNYNCPFMLARIRVHQDQYVLQWMTPDDEIGYEFLFDKDQLDKVKRFITNNHKSKEFDVLLSIFIEQNNFKYY